MTGDRGLPPGGSREPTERITPPDTTVPPRRSSSLWGNVVALGLVLAVAAAITIGAVRYLVPSAVPANASPSPTATAVPNVTLRPIPPVTPTATPSPTPTRTPAPTPRASPTLRLLTLPPAPALLRTPTPTPTRTP